MQKLLTKELQKKLPPLYSHLDSHFHCNSLRTQRNALR